MNRKLYFSMSLVMLWLVVTIITLSPAHASAQGTPLSETATNSIAAFNDPWAFTYGGSSIDIATSLIETSDGGLIATGYTESFGAGSGEAWVLKINADGTIAWQNTYGSTDRENFDAIMETGDGGFLAYGYTQSFEAGRADLWLVKLNADGTVAWENTYGGSSFDGGSVIATSDGGFIVGGYTESFGAGQGDAWVLKLNADGSIAWQNTYGGSGYEGLNGIVETSTGDYLAAGFTNGAGSEDLWLLKLNSSGGILWQNRYGGAQRERAQAITDTGDGSYLVVGYTDSFSVGWTDVWLLDVNDDGTLNYQKTYGGSGGDAVFIVTPTSDGRFLVSGRTASFGNSSYDGWILKLNRDGSIAWENTYGANATTGDLGFVSEASDGSILAAGSLTSPHSYDALLTRLDATGNIANCNYIEQSQAIVGDTSIAPIPTNTTTQATSVSPTAFAATVQSFSPNLQIRCAALAAACAATP